MNVTNFILPAFLLGGQLTGTPGVGLPSDATQIF